MCTRAVACAAGVLVFSFPGHEPESLVGRVGGNEEGRSRAMLRESALYSRLA